MHELRQVIRGRAIDLPRRARSACSRVQPISRGRILDVISNADFFKTIEGTITTTADLASMGVASANVKCDTG